MEFKKLIFKQHVLPGYDVNKVKAKDAWLRIGLFSKSKMAAGGHIKKVQYCYSL